MHDVNVDIAHDGTEHEFHIGVLIVFGADLKSRLELRAPTGFRDVSGQESRDLVVPVDAVSRTAGVRGMPWSSRMLLRSGTHEFGWGGQAAHAEGLLASCCGRAHVRWEKRQ